jgi:NAD+ kinase
MSDVIVVAKRTAYAQHVLERRDPDAIALLDAGDPSVARWRQAHADHEQTLGRVLEILGRLGLGHVVLPAHTAFHTQGTRLVVTVGGDGTLLSASHHVGDCPVLGVNSSPEHSIGFFCAARGDNIEAMLEGAIADALPRLCLSRMQVEVGEEVCSRRVLNDALFCHAIPAATSRYILEFGGEAEEQRSSGLWIGPAAGSTGAIRSAGGEVLPLSSQALQLVVREPYLYAHGAYRMQKLIAEAGETLIVRNKMRDARLFIDGPFASFDVALGAVLHFRLSPEPLTLLGLDDRERARLDAES